MEQSWYRELDLDTPSPARVYDYFLGGSHNFAIDREMAQRLVAVKPDVAEIMRANRAFLRRAVQHLVGVGVRQFLDLGSGVPTVGNVHEIAQRSAPDARVVYVDVDPIAVAHSTAMLEDNPLAGVVRADLRDTETVLGHPVVGKLIDFAEPVALLVVGVLHQLPGDEPLAAIRRYRDQLGPGSYLALTQVTQDGRRRERTELLKETFDGGYANGADVMTMRTRPEVLAFFEEFELIEPGLVFVANWRPEVEVPDPERLSTYAAVGRR
ncbi:SAM-dependent methyltransferase [Micromonospora sp. CPCC 206061]|uniref:SAM-dependent methyltransferase n=1 Tax=Micromonospora sp. CPCC 206061 TaxID=3122410 RepID=UPI002FF3253E